MSLRLFSCPACDHRLRFGARNCGRCHAPTPYYNHKAAVALFAVLVLAAFPILIALL